MTFRLPMKFCKTCGGLFIVWPLKMDEVLVNCGNCEPRIAANWTYEMYAWLFGTSICKLCNQDTGYEESSNVSHMAKQHNIYYLNSATKEKIFTN